MGIIVQKFGGSSVATKERMEIVLNKVKKALDNGNKVIAILSARSGETNGLLDLASEWSENPDPAELDVLVSTGEQVSVALFSMLLIDNGILARSFLASQIPIVTDKHHCKAHISTIDSKNLLDNLEKYDVLVVAGFQGITDEHRITTLGRGGSDTTAVAIAAAIKADLCEIYTDVDGVYTTDPNVYDKAQKIDRVSYEEMLEMASMGTKVLEIRSVEFSKKYNVPLCVRSTFSEAPGTLITHEDTAMENVTVSAIAFDKDQARISIQGIKDVPGIAASIFKPLSDSNISVDMIIQTPSLNNVTDMNFTVSKKDLKRAISTVENNKNTINYSSLSYEENIVKVSAIGVGMRNHPGVAAQFFTALSKENINILMISTSEIKISCIIEAKYAELAVRVLHSTFNLDSKN